MEKRDGADDSNNNSQPNQLKFSGKAIPTRNIVEWNTIPHPENNYIDSTSFSLNEEEFKILKQYQNNFKELNKSNYWSKSKNVLVSSHNGYSHISYFQPEIVSGYYLPFKVKKNPITQIAASPSPVMDSNAEFNQDLSIEMGKDTDLHTDEFRDSPIATFFTERLGPVESTSNISSNSIHNTASTNKAIPVQNNSPEPIRTSVNTHVTPSQPMASSTPTQNLPISTGSRIPNSATQVQATPQNAQKSSVPTAPTQNSPNTENAETRNVNQPYISQSQSDTQSENITSTVSTNQSIIAAANPTHTNLTPGVTANNDQNKDIGLPICQDGLDSIIPTQSHHLLSTSDAPSVAIPSQSNLFSQQADQAQSTLLQSVQSPTFEKHTTPPNDSTAQVRSPALGNTGLNAAEINSYPQSLLLENTTSSQQLLLNTRPQNSVALPDFTDWDIPFDFDVLYDLTISYDFIRSYKNILFNDLVSQLSESFWFFCFTFLNPDISTLQIHIMGHILKCLYVKNSQIKPPFPLEQVSISNFNLFLLYSIQSFKIPLPGDSTPSKNLNIYTTSRRYRICLTKNIIIALVKSSKLDMQGLYVTSQDFKTIKRANSNASLLADFTWTIMIQTHDYSQQVPNNDNRATSIENSTTTSVTIIPITPTDQNSENGASSSNNEKITLSSIKPIIQKLMIFKPLDKLLDIGLLSLIKEFQIIHLGIDRLKRSYYYFASIGGIIVKESSNKINSWKIIDNLQTFNQLLNSLYSSNYQETKLLDRLSQLRDIFTEDFLKKVKSSMTLLRVPYYEAIKNLMQSDEIPSYSKLDTPPATEIHDMLILNDYTPISFPTFKVDWVSKIQIAKIENSMKQMLELLEVPSESEISTLLSRFKSSSLPDLSIERTCQEFLAKLQVHIDQESASSHSKPDQFRFLKNFVNMNKYFMRASILLYNHLTDDLNAENLPSNIRSTNEFNEIYIISALELIKNCMNKVFKGDENYRVHSLLYKDRSCLSLHPHKQQKCHFHYNIPDTIQFAKIKLPDTSKIPRRRKLPEKRNTAGRRSSGRGRINYKETVISDSETSTETKSTKTTGSKKSNRSKKGASNFKKQAKLDPFIRRKLTLTSSSSSDLSDLDKNDPILNFDSNSELPASSKKSKLLKNSENATTSENSDEKAASNKRNRSKKDRRIIRDSSDDDEDDKSNNSRTRKRLILSSDDDLNAFEESPTKVRSPSPFEDGGFSPFSSPFEDIDK